MQDLSTAGTPVIATRQIVTPDQQTIRRGAGGQIVHVLLESPLQRHMILVAWQGITGNHYAFPEEVAIGTRAESVQS